MNAEERKVLLALNAELEARGETKRFTPHRFHPMTRVLWCHLDYFRVARYWTAHRRLDVFTQDNPASMWGNTKTIGDYTGRGWLDRLASDLRDREAQVSQLETQLGGVERDLWYGPAGELLKLRYETAEGETFEFVRR